MFCVKFMEKCKEKGEKIIFYTIFIYKSLHFHIQTRIRQKIDKLSKNINFDHFLKIFSQKIKIFHFFKIVKIPDLQVLRMIG